MVVIFLPAYNEEIALTRILPKFDLEMKKSNEAYRVVLLDDGSTDETREVARRLAKNFPLQILWHEKNQGLGAAMKDGFEHLAKTTADDDWVVTLDADDTHEPKFLSSALSKIREGYDLVILSRYLAGGGQEGLSFLKKLFSAGAGIFLRIFFPIPGVREYSCNYRVYRASILKKAVRKFGGDFIRLSKWGFVVTPEILIKMRMLNARIAESPFMLQYQQKPTRSANRPLRTICGYFALVWNYWGRRRLSS